MAQYTREEIVRRYKKMRRAAKLNEREMQILDLRFGFVDGESHTFEEVARAFGVTRERIRQIEAKAFEKMSIEFD